MHKFANDTDLLTHARHFVNERVNSLESDARQCLLKEDGIAPFPAVLYCFATIDLLGSLTGGRADGSHTKLSIKYMTCFMDYTIEDATILIDLFRHKLVHLAQPSPVIRYGKERITWQHHHNNGGLHLKKLSYPQDKEIDDVPSDWHIPVTHQFNISIMDFVKDIKNSATKPNGYLDVLEKSPYMQVKYERAINQIYEVN